MQHDLAADYFPIHEEVSVEELAAQLRSEQAWLMANETEYEAIRNELHDPEWLEAAVALSLNVLETLKQFAGDDPPSKAAFLIGQAQVSLDSIKAKYDLVADYEARKQNLDTIYRQIEAS